MFAARPTLSIEIVAVGTGADRDPSVAIEPFDPRESSHIEEAIMLGALGTCGEGVCHEAAVGRSACPNS